MRLLQAVLRNRNLAMLELVWAMATLTRWALAILVGLYAYRAGGASAVGLAAVARIAPAALLAPRLALTTDRRSRRQVLVWSVLARLLLTVAMSLAVAQSASLVVVVALAGGFSIADIVHKPAQIGLMAATARDPGELAAANALWSTVDNAGFLVGSLTVGVIVAVWGPIPAFAACTLPLAVALLALLGVSRDQGLGIGAETQGAGSEMAAGLRTVVDNKDLRSLVGLSVLNLFSQSILDVLLIVVALGLLEMGEAGAGWLNAAWGIGGVLGGLLATGLLARRRLAAGLRWGLVLSGIPLLALAMWPTAGAAMAEMVIVGAGIALVEVALLTLGQRLVAAEVMARVYGLEETLCVFATVAGSFVASGLVVVGGERVALACTGLILPLAAALRWMRLRRFESEDVADPVVFARLREVPAFATLPVATVETMTMRSSSTTVPAGTPIVTQGEVGEEFFVVESGTVEVHESGEFRRVEGAGDYFGEIALLRDVPRTATVTARTDVSLVVIPRTEFLAAVGAYVRTRTDLEAGADSRLGGAD